MEKRDIEMETQKLMIDEEVQNRWRKNKRERERERGGGVEQGTAAPGCQWP